MKMYFLKTDEIDQNNAGDCIGVTDSSTWTEYTTEEFEKAFNVKLPTDLKHAINRLDQIEKNRFRAFKYDLRAEVHIDKCSCFYEDLSGYLERNNFHRNPRIISVDVDYASIMENVMGNVIE